MLGIWCIESEPNESDDNGELNIQPFDFETRSFDHRAVISCLVVFRSVYIYMYIYRKMGLIKIFILNFLKAYLTPLR